MEYTLFDPTQKPGDGGVDVIGVAFAKMYVGSSEAARIMSAEIAVDSVFTHSQVSIVSNVTVFKITRSVSDQSASTSQSANDEWHTNRHLSGKRF